MTHHQTRPPSGPCQKRTRRGCCPERFERVHLPLAVLTTDDRDVATLMAHPDGVEIVRAFERSAARSAPVSAARTARNDGHTWAHRDALKWTHPGMMNPSVASRALLTRKPGTPVRPVPADRGPPAAPLDCLMRSNRGLTVLTASGRGEPHAAAMLEIAARPDAQHSPSRPGRGGVRRGEYSWVL